MDKPLAGAPRAAWLSIVFAAASASAWSASYADLLRDPLASVVFLLAGPLGFAGVIVGIVHVARRARTLWIPIAGIALSIGATTYIVVQLLSILARLAFA